MCMRFGKQGLLGGAIDNAHAFLFNLFNYLGKRPVQVLLYAAHLCFGVDMSWRIAIVGRPNVGKSTLFNRLAHKQLAIVHDQPGVTRDYRLAEIEHMGMSITLIDTAGWEPPTSRQEDSIMAKMRVQTEAALAQADAVILVVDGRDGLVPADQILPIICARWINR